MKKIRTRQFLKALYISLGFSASFLLWMLVFGKQLAAYYFDSIAGCVFTIMAVAVLSFVGICFLPYFRGDKRWFAIPSVLTAAFFMGSALLWQFPTVNAVV